MRDRIYPGKIILFGEYTIINGGEVLAIPTSKMGARWAYAPSSDDRDATLMDYADYLSSMVPPPIDLELFLEDVNQGIFLQSDIPVGYGCGSSGALVAAVFDSYNSQTQKYSLIELKEIFSRMESFFHGKSSGIDPLVSFLNRPVLINNDGIEILDGDFNGLMNNFFLLDSGKSKSTAEYVKIFNDKTTDKEFARKIDLLKDVVNMAIQNLVLHSDPRALHENIKEISMLQWSNFQEMIPVQIKSLWKSALEQSDHTIKLCGSGGGGYFLVYAENSENTDLELIPV